MPTPPTETPTGTAPAIVAFVRSLLIVVIIGAITALIAALTGADLSSIPPEWRPLAAAALVIVVRTLEGLVDQLRGQAPQAGPLGSTPASATAYIDTSAGTNLGALPYALANAIDGGREAPALSTADLESLLASTAARLEERNAAPPASPVTSNAA